MKDLLQELVRFFEDWSAVNADGADWAEILVAEMQRLSETQPFESRMVPVVEQWTEVSLELETAVSVQPLITQFRQHFHNFQWHPAKHDYIEGDGFAKGFAYTHVVDSVFDGVSSSPYESDKIAVGFSLQAPNLFYPPHHHKAVELYGVLSGAARWQLDRATPKLQPTGTLIFHDSDVPHAMETSNEPMLTVWAWLGDVNSGIEVPSYSWLV